jgi:hypothetical protein
MHFCGIAELCKCSIIAEYINYAFALHLQNYAFAA